MSRIMIIASFSLLGFATATPSTVSSAETQIDVLITEAEDAAHIADVYDGAVFATMSEVQTLAKESELKRREADLVEAKIDNMDDPGGIATLREAISKLQQSIREIVRKEELAREKANSQQESAEKAMIEANRKIYVLGKENAPFLKAHLIQLGDEILQENSWISDEKIVASAEEVSANLPFIYTQLADGIAIRELDVAVQTGWESCLVSKDNEMEFSIAELVLRTVNLGKLTVTSTPSGATISVGGEVWDEKSAPKDSKKPFRFLSEGSYTIELTNDEDKKSDDIHIPRGKPMVYHCDF